MSKFKLLVDKKQYNSKPTDAGRITNEIINSEKEVTAEELADLVGNKGHTMVLATMNGSRKANNMVQQQVLALDFDNKDENGNKEVGLLYRTLEETLEDPYIQRNAAFAYKTFSYSENWEKFRIVFVLDKPLTKLEEVKGAYAFLASKYPDSDSAPTSPASIFYGGVEAIEINYNNVLTTEDLPTAAKAPVREPKTAISSIKKEKITPAAIEDDEEPTWKLIQKGEKELVKERLSVYSAKLHSKVQSMNYLKSLDMAEVLGVRFNPTFDFFHYETKPSAGIFKMDEADIYLYKCHSSSHPFTGDIIQVISKLTGLSFMGSINYLIEVTDIQIEMTEQIHSLLEQCSVFQNTLLSTNLKDSYPAIHNRFWRYKTDINAILDIFKENIYEDEKGELRSLTWMSSENLAIKLYGNKSKNGTIKRILNLMAYTEWIDKLDDNQIPEELLKSIKASQNSNGYQRRSNVFELLNLGSDFFQRLNKQCEVMEEEGFTMKGFSKEYVLNANGKEVADKVYVQEKSRGISKTSTDLNADIYQLVEFHLSEETHIVVADLLEELTAKWKSKNLVETKFKQVLPKLLKEKKLQKSRLTKQLREKWNLPLTQSSPVVIYTAFE